MTAPEAASLADALRGLLVATRLWARGTELDTVAVDAACDAALVRLHHHHAAAIPVYRRLAEQAGLLEVCDASALARELIVTSHLFKSYDARALGRADFVAMTDWLATLFVRVPAIDSAGVEDIAGWRARLRADGVFLALSSGTTGSPSIVARDHATLTALRSNGQLYGPGGDRPSDCLALAPAGGGSGLHASAAGLAARAARAHHLELGDDPEPAWTAALDFARAAAAGARPLLVFGPPARVLELCERAPGPLADGSMVVTGGGWKGGAALGYEALVERAVRALGVPAARVVDTYGAAELNVFLTRCPHGRYHVPPLLRAIVVDELLVPVEDAEAEGRIAFLDPFAFSYPGFVAPGDVAHLVRGACACGLHGPALFGDIRRATDEAARGCAVVESVA